MVIHVKDHLAGCDTNEEGDALFDMVADEIRRTGAAVVDFHGVLYTTTSFINSAFVPLLECMTLDEIKKGLRVINAYPQIADMIRRRMSDESALAAA